VTHEHRLLGVGGPSSCVYRGEVSSKCESPKARGVQPAVMRHENDSGFSDGFLFSLQIGWFPSNYVEEDYSEYC
jgi:hypothetical protein